MGRGKLLKRKALVQVIVIHVLSFLAMQVKKVRAWGYGPFLDDEEDEGKHIYNKRFICSLDDGELEMYVDKDEMINTAAYIAAMNPVTAKALIARIRELEDENKKLR